MALVTRIRIVNSDNKRQNDVQKLKHRSHKSKGFRCECSIVLVLVTFTAILLICGGVAMSVVSFQAGPILNLEDSPSKPKQARETLGETQARQFTLLYNLRYFGPVTAGIGWFAIIIASVVAYQDDSSKKRASGGGVRRTNTAADVYDEGIELFKHNEALRQKQLEAELRESAQQPHQSRIGEQGAGGGGQRRRSSSFQSLDGAIYKLGSILLPSVFPPRRPSQSTSIKENTVGSRDHSSADESDCVDSLGERKQPQWRSVRAPNPLIPTQRVVTMQVVSREHTGDSTCSTLGGGGDSSPADSDQTEHVPSSSSGGGGSKLEHKLSQLTQISE